MIKGSGQKKFKGKGVVFLVIFNLFFVHLPAFGEPLIPGYYGSKDLPPLPSYALPQVKMEAGQIKADGIQSIVKKNDNQLVVYQNQKDAIISWDSFNIGKDAHTHFDQQGQTGWAVLNRIYDHSPSQILGKLTADGKVFLINQNGILFGPDSRVNIHSLIASSLNLRNDYFMNREDKDFVRTLKFKLENYQYPSDNPPSDAVVSNHGHIETGYGGSVFLFGSSVENNGIIDSPVGQIGLAAGSEIELIIPKNLDESRSGYVVKNRATGNTDVVVEGIAENFENGQLISDLGLAGMYGRIIKQDGLIRSVRAVQKNGNIELLAAEKVITGEKSVTACSVSDSQEKVLGSSSLESKINIGGWTPDATSDKVESTLAGQIEHKGIILAPSGAVAMRAEHKVYLGEGSVIDVSGLWADLPAEDNFLKIKLNSVELRDDYGQKYGPLKETTITFNAYGGSSIGNVSNSLSIEEKTAIENCTEGGGITIEAGDIIFKKGASLDFSGGGIYYGQGFGSTTKLLAGNTIYDISTAPQWVHYDKVLDVFYEEYPRLGIKIPYEGLYYGGIVPILDYQPSHLEGHDAGSLSLLARRIVLDGQLDGSAYRGVFQTQLSTPLDELGFETVSEGVVQPQGGILKIGEYNPATSYEDRDLYTNEIVIQKEVQPLEDFGPDDELPDTFITRFSENQINDTGLSKFCVYSNIGITTEKDTRLVLPPGGFFEAVARSIVHQGEIIVPSGMIKFTSDSNFTSLGVNDPRHVDLPENLPEGIHIEEESTLIASGEKIDYILPVTISRINGGTISLVDRGLDQEGIHIGQGSLLDVSGGYTVNSKGKIKGGDAGILELTSLNLSLESDMAGYSLSGQSGGTLSLHTGEIRIISKNPVSSVSSENPPESPESTEEELVLADDFFSSTGFSHIQLKSENNIQITDGSLLAPSQVKLAEPLVKMTSGSSPAYIVEEPDINSMPYVTLPQDYPDSTSITCSAGMVMDRNYAASPNLDAELRVDAGAKVQTPVGGKIELKAPVINIAGTVETLAGNISISATEHDLTLEETARIVAAGYNKPDEKPLADDLVYGFTPLSGGSVKLNAGKAEIGNLYLQNGCLIDVSGSEPAFTLVEKNDGTYEYLPSAGSAGSITLSFGGNINPTQDNDGKTIQGKLEGVKLIGHAKMDGMTGGELIIEKKNSSSGLSIYADDMKRIVQKGSLDQSGGFDALMLRSQCEIDFTESLSLTPGRSLVLDAPLLKASGEEAEEIYLRSAWLSIMNSFQYNIQSPEEGESLIRCSGNWIDVKGDIQFSRFQDVQLKSEHDLTLSDMHNTIGIQDFGWKGELNIAGDLTLEAERIYPTTFSQFTIHSDQKITTLPGMGTPSGLMYSAGGKLIIEAKSIEHRGTLAAPMGEIIFCQNEGDGENTQQADRIYMAEGSKIITTGETSVHYGNLSDSIWTITDKSDKNDPNKQQEAELPHNSVTINGSEIILENGAKITVDGGGSIFAYQFLPGIEGTENPLSEEGISVIFPDNSIVKPGKAVYLEGVSGVPDGVYSLLPAEFAFIPGAMIITDLGVCNTYDTSAYSKEGSLVTRGFTIVRDTGFTETIPHLYSVRTAAEILKNEGNFTVAQMTAGDGGKIKINGDTCILEGVMSGKPLQYSEDQGVSYEGDLIELSGKTIFVGQNYETLLPDFSFDDEIPTGLKGKLYIDADGLSENGFKEISLGSLAKNGEKYQGTESITVEDGAHLVGTNLTLSATQNITVESPTQDITAESDPQLDAEGDINLISPEGTITIEKDAKVHAGNALNLECQNLTVTGKIKADNKTLNLTSSRIVIVSDLLHSQSETGLVLTREEFSSITDGFTDITITGRDELVFKTSLELHLGDAFLSLDTPKITGLGLDNGDSVKITGSEVSDGDSVGHIPMKKISFLNTTGNLPDTGSTLADTGALTGSLVFNAEEIVIGCGDILFDGFKKIDLTSKNDLTFSGKGSMSASGEELNITAARVTASSYQDNNLSSQDEELTYEVSRFTIDAPTGQVTITGNSEGAKGESIVPGGNLSISAKNITLDGIIEIQSGQIALNAHEAGEGQGIFLESGSQILAQGSDYAPGGKVLLSAENGQIDIQGSQGELQSALIDVSAGAQGDAGNIDLYAPNGQVVLDGEIKGDAKEKKTEEGKTKRGMGGSFTLDAGGFGRADADAAVHFAQLNSKLKSGGFDHSVDLRFRTGDIIVAENEHVVAHSVKFAADGYQGDGGNIDISGIIEAPAYDLEAGRVELYAANNLTLQASKQIGDKKTGIYAPGGEVILSTTNGILTLGGANPNRKRPHRRSF